MTAEHGAGMSCSVPGSGSTVGGGARGNGYGARYGPWCHTVVHLRVPTNPENHENSSKIMKFHEKSRKFKKIMKFHDSSIKKLGQSDTRARTLGQSDTRARTLGQSDSRTRGQSDSRTRGQSDSRTRGRTLRHAEGHSDTRKDTQTQKNQNQIRSGYKSLNPGINH